MTKINGIIQAVLATFLISLALYVFSGIVGIGWLYYASLTILFLWMIAFLVSLIGAMIHFSKGI